MVQIKAWTFYLDIYAEDSYKWDRRINIYGAIASSSSIAAWTIWRSWSFIWAAIIAISQVLTAIKQYLPFGRRLKYLQPFIEDLNKLWNKGVMVYDAYNRCEFRLNAILMWTINDFPAYGNLAGCTVKGKRAYPVCGINTCSIWLLFSK